MSEAPGATAAFELRGRRIFVAGDRGMVGGAIVQRLQRESCTVLTAARKDVDMRNQASVDAWMATNKPDVVVIAAAKVGGIQANNTYPAQFLYDNLMIAANLIEAARIHGVDRLLSLGSSCIYPKFAEQPIREDALLTGPLEATNEWYAVAKIAGLKMTEAYRKQYGLDYVSAMPTNLYGPGDNFDLASSHVLPALIRKAHEAKLAGARELVVWGSGAPLREFLHVDDCADAMVFLLKHYSQAQHINVGSGSEISIGDLARLVADIVGFRGSIVMDASKPDGTPRKLMDSSRLNALGWTPKVDLRSGVESTYRWFLEANPRLLRA